MEKIFTPSAEQSKFLDWVANGTGSAVLEAVAGAGKTTTLVEAVKLMKGSVFLGAYNKKIADELKERLSGMVGKKAGTFHSAGYSALWRSNNDIKIEEHKVDDIVRPMVENTEYEISEFITAVKKLVSLAKQTGFYVNSIIPNVQRRFYVELINRYDIADSLPEGDFYENALPEYADRVLRESNARRDIIDFDDMVYLPLLWNLRLFKNDWVLIDEAQDTNAVRRELASRMLRHGGRLVAVGDPHQAIYGFTGADNESLELIKRKFNAITLKLSVSWRCPRSVVAAAQEYVDHIHAADTAPEGVVSSVTYKAMLKTVKPGDAVICRFNAPLIELCFKLIREGKPAKIEGRAIGEGLAALAGRWKLKTVNQLEARLKLWHEKEIAKLEASKNRDEGKIQRQEDKFFTMTILIDRARENSITELETFKAMILDMFADVGASKGLIVLSSVHRSKGLEWENVHILGRRELMPSTRVSQEWQMQQEINLCYVAVTRAKVALIDVAMPTPKDLERPKKEEKEAEEAK